MDSATSKNPYADSEESEPKDEKFQNKHPADTVEAELAMVLTVSALLVAFAGMIVDSVGPKSFRYYEAKCLKAKEDNDTEVVNEAYWCNAASNNIAIISWFAMLGSAMGYIGAIMLYTSWRTARPANDDDESTNIFYQSINVKMLFIYLSMTITVIAIAGAQFMLQLFKFDFKFHSTFLYISLVMVVFTFIFLLWTIRDYKNLNKFRRVRARTMSMMQRPQNLILSTESTESTSDPEDKEEGVSSTPLTLSPVETRSLNTEPVTADPIKPSENKINLTTGPTSNTTGETTSPTVEKSSSPTITETKPLQSQTTPTPTTTDDKKSTESDKDQEAVVDHDDENVKHANNNTNDDDELLYVNNDIKTNDDDELLYVNNDIKTNHSLVSHEYINVDDSVKNPNPKHESSDTKFNVPTENTSSDNATTTDKSQQQSQEVVITTKPLYENVTSPVTPTARPRSQLNKGSEDNATEEPVQTAQTEPSPKREDFEEEAITI